MMRLSAVWTAIAAVLCALCLIAPLPPAVGDALYTVGLLVLLAAMAYGVVQATKVDSRAGINWILLAASAFLVVSEVAGTWMSPGSLSVPFLGESLLLRIPFYALVILGCARLIGLTCRAFPLSWPVESVVTATTLAVIGATLLARPIVELPRIERAVELAPSVLAAVVAGAMIHVATYSALGSRAKAMLAVAGIGLYAAEILSMWDASGGIEPLAIAGAPTLLFVGGLASASSGQQVSVSGAEQPGVEGSTVDNPGNDEVESDSSDEENTDALRPTPGRLAILVGAPAALALVALFRVEAPVSIFLATTTVACLVGWRIFALGTAIEQGNEQMRLVYELDSMTGLANRSAFLEQGEAALIRSRGAGAKGLAAVLIVDVDGLKETNDSLGHDAGDEVLLQTANRLLSCVRPHDLVARLGGDDFAVLLSGVGELAGATAVARRVLESMMNPVDFGNRAVRASVSIGVALDEEGTTGLKTLIRNADVAAQLAKTRGKARYEVFEADTHSEAVERVELRSELQRAVDGDEFYAEYQPIFDLGTGQPVLMECLVRWQHPDKGRISPDAFIPLAEETGLIVPLGKKLLDRACKEALSWQAVEGYEEVGLTFNLSSRQLSDEALVETVSQALEDSGLPPELLVLEVTESMLSSDTEASEEALAALADVGIKLAIDDFGTGYSSLTYLREFPVDSIKIDRTFISDLHRSSTSSGLVEAVVNLADALKAEAVAEGIEYPEQVTVLQRLGCSRGQGFFFCRPLAVADLVEFCRANPKAAVPAQIKAETSEPLSTSAKPPAVPSVQAKTPVPSPPKSDVVSAGASAGPGIAPPPSAGSIPSIKASVPPPPPPPPGSTGPDRDPDWATGVEAPPPPPPSRSSSSSTPSTGAEAPAPPAPRPLVPRPPVPPTPVGDAGPSDAAPPPPPPSSPPPPPSSSSSSPPRSSESKVPPPAVPSSEGQGKTQDSGSSAAGSFDAEVLTGLTALEELSDEIDGLVDGLRMPVMTKSGWLILWSKSFTDWIPLSVTVRDRSGDLVGFASLATKPDGGETDVVAVGHGVSFFTGLSVVGSAAVQALATAISDAVHSLPGTWGLNLEQLAEHDLVAQVLADKFAYGRLLPERRIPRLVFSTAHSVEDVIGETNSEILATARAQLKEQEIATYVGFDRGSAISSHLIDELEMLRLRRDHDLDRASDLDDDARRSFWRGLIAGRDGQWEAEVATVRLDGQLAAYTAAIVDRDTYRIFDGRIDGDWERYRPGQLVEAAALRRALTDDNLAAVDWMSRSGAGDLLASNMADGRQRLVASSSGKLSPQDTVDLDADE